MKLRVPEQRLRPAASYRASPERKAERERFQAWARSQVAPDLTELLCKLRPALDRESDKTRAALSFIVGISGRRSRRHSRCPGAFFVTRKELHALFHGGPSFEKLNDRHHLIETVSGWLPVNFGMDWMPGQVTRAYRLAADVQTEYDRYRAAYCDQVGSAVASANPVRKEHAAIDPAEFFVTTELRPARFVSATGRVQRSVRTAIAHENADGWRSDVWDGVELRALVPVDLDSLCSLRVNLDSILREGWERGGVNCPLSDSEREHVRALHAETSDLIMAACSEAGGFGMLQQRLAVAKEGRLYAQNSASTPSLQNCATVVRHAAMRGRFELDISNAHLSFLFQLAAAKGTECKHIALYLANKKAVRQQLARRHDIPLDLVKQSLIAVVYGACPWVFYGKPEEVGADFKPTLVKLLGERRALTLQDDRLFKYIAADVRKARSAILRTWSKGRQRLYGAFGGSVRLRDLEETYDRRKKVMRKKKTGPARQLACVLQDIEAAMLRAVVYEYGQARREPGRRKCDRCPGDCGCADQVLVVQHDGWVAAKKMDRAEVETLLKRATVCEAMPEGFTVSVEQEPIGPLSMSKLAENIWSHSQDGSKTYGMQGELTTGLWPSPASSGWAAGGPEAGAGGWIPDPDDPQRFTRPYPLMMPAALALA